jgi:hypothetical protein
VRVNVLFCDGKSTDHVFSQNATVAQIKWKLAEQLGTKLAVELHVMDDNRDAPDTLKNSQTVQEVMRFTMSDCELNLAAIHIDVDPSSWAGRALAAQEQAAAMWREAQDHQQQVKQVEKALTEVDRNLQRHTSTKNIEGASGGKAGRR